MCGRYAIFDGEELRDLRQIVEEVSRQHPDTQVKTGEIYPTNQAPVLLSEQGELSADLLTWGYPGFNGKGVIINARSETVEQKRMFADSVLHRRCVIPSSGFYEWSKDKEKYLFQREHKGVLYMAGLYREFEGVRRYVILTTDANASISDIHHRMPLVLEPGELSRWVFDRERAIELLHGRPPMLQRSAV